MSVCLKRGCSSTQKKADIALKNAALDVFYGPAYKTQLHVFSLSRVFLKWDFCPYGAAFL